MSTFDYAGLRDAVLAGSTGGVRWSKRMLRYELAGHDPEIRDAVGLPPAASEPQGQVAALRQIIYDRFAAWGPSYAKDGGLRFTYPPTRAGSAATQADMLLLPMEEFDPPPTALLKVPAELCERLPPSVVARVLSAAGSYPAFDTPAGHRFLVLLMHEMRVCSMHPRVISAVASWFQAALAGERVTFFAGVCPDYATDCGRYTFSDVGDGVGLVASRVMEVLPALQRFITNMRLDARLVVAIGDMEVFPDSASRRFGISREEFLARLQRSQVAFRSAAEAVAPGIGEILDTPMLTDLLPGAGPAYDLGSRMSLWDQRQHIVRLAVDAHGLAGPLPMGEHTLESIATSREGFYRQWFGPRLPARHHLFGQVMDYAGIGAIADQLPHALMLRADSACMEPFVHGGSPTARAVVTLKRDSY